MAVGECVDAPMQLVDRHGLDAGGGRDRRGEALPPRERAASEEGPDQQAGGGGGDFEHHARNVSAGPPVIETPVDLKSTRRRSAIRDRRVAWRPMKESTSRRGFLGAALGGATATLTLGGLRGAMAAARAVPRSVGADELAMDEDFWSEIQRAFHVDRSLINLNNGGVSPAPETAMESLRRFDEHSNHAPARTMWRRRQST